MEVFDQMLSRYNLQTDADVYNATREIMQEITLAGLYRGGFFNKAAFYGGTCLRIFYKLDRFSEDLDFSLLQSDLDFKFEPYFKSVIAEFAALGIDVEIAQKQKTHVSNIESAFLKQTTPIYTLQIHDKKKIKIKFEVDTNPPMGFEIENKLLLQPFSFYVSCFTLSDLFAGKMHALLFRQWKSRVKGRDWYDFEWYVRNRVKLNLSHFAERAFQSKHIFKNSLNREDFMQMLNEKMETVDFKSAANEVSVFIKNPSVTDIWSKDYFTQLAEMIEFKEIS
ncbi:MAG: nucleotidyl transferase AbiEii/AbiGii toxin family protein [Bacteroidales bacterium]|nr:nucleotidyl transferase AbiEii/AbiGii toxin family protein [Bacteroidales bacterium]MDY0217363.1 nucleotidyl transferase AbiEii/AbiGii toxin family protein [Bacteroidales bacterium]